MDSTLCTHMISTGHKDNYLEVKSNSPLNFSGKKVYNVQSKQNLTSSLFYRYSKLQRGHCIMSPDLCLYSMIYFSIPNLGNELFLPAMTFIISQLKGKLHKCIWMKLPLLNQGFTKRCEGITR